MDLYKQKLSTLITTIAPDFDEHFDDRDLIDIYQVGFDHLSKEMFVDLMDISTEINCVFTAVSKSQWKSLVKIFTLTIQYEHEIIQLCDLLTYLKTFHKNISFKTARNIRSFNDKIIIGTRSYIKTHGTSDICFPLKGEEQMEMYENVKETFIASRTILSKVPQTMDKLNLTMDDVKFAIENVSTNSDTITSSVVNLKDMLVEFADTIKPTAKKATSFVSFVDEIINNVKLHADGLAAQFYLLSTTDETPQQLAIITTILSLLGLSQQIVTRIQDLFSKKNSGEEQADFKGTKMFVGFISAMMGNNSPIKKFSSMSLASIVKEAEAVDKLTDMFVIMLQEWGFMEDSIVKLNNMLKEDVAVLFEKLATFETMFKVSPQKFNQQAYFVSFETAFKRIKDIKTDIMGDRSRIYDEVKTLYQFYKKLNERIRELRSGSARRCEPAAFCIVGAPGIGKTDFMVDLVTNSETHSSLLYKRFLDNSHDTDSVYDVIDPKYWSVWTENLQKECKYQDGYFGQEIHIADDAFQNSDNSDHISWINYISSAKFITNQAAIDDKGRSYDSRLVVNTCNEFPISSKVIKSVGALQRRFKVIKAVAIRPVPTGAKDITYSHLQFTCYENGTDYISNRHGRILNVSEIADWVLRTLMGKWAYFESCLGATQADNNSNSEENFEDADSAFPPPPPMNWEKMTFEDFKDLRKVQLPKQLIELTTCSSKFKNQLLYKTFRRLKFEIHNHAYVKPGEYYLADLMAMADEWGKMDYILEHLDMSTSFSRNKFFQALDGVYFIKSGQKYLVIGPICYTVPLNDAQDAEDESQYEDYFNFRKNAFSKDWFYGMFRKFKGYLGALAKFAQDCHEKYVTFLAHALHPLALFIARIFGFDDPETLIEIHMFLIVFGASFTYQMCMYALMFGVTFFLNKIMLNFVECNKCMVGLKARLLIEEYSDFACKNECKLGVLWNTHTKICQSYKILSKAISAAVCNCKCQDCCHASKVELDTRGTDSLVLWLQGRIRAKDRKLSKSNMIAARSIIRVIDDVVLDCDCDASKICETHSYLKEDIADHIINYGDEENYDPMLYNGKKLSETNRAPKKVDNPLAMFENSADSLKIKRRAQLENSGDSLKLKMRAQLEDDMCEEIKDNLKGDEEMCFDPGAIDVLKKIQKSMVRVSVVTPSTDVYGVYGVGFNRSIICPAHVSRIKGKISFEKDGKNVPMVLVNANPDLDLAIYSFSNKDCADFSSSVYNYIPTKEELLRAVASVSRGVLFLPKSELNYSVFVNYVAKPSIPMKNGNINVYTNLLKVSTLSYSSPPSMKGDCGGPLVLMNPKLAHKFVGIHVIGTATAGYSAMLYKEAIDELMINAQEEMSVAEDEKFIIDCKLKYPVIDVMNLIQLEHENPRFRSHGDIDYIGAIPYRTVPATVTNLKQHLFYETFPVTQRPSALTLGQVEDLTFLQVNDYGNPDLVWTQFKKYAKEFNYNDPEVKEILGVMTEQLVDIFNIRMKGTDLSKMTQEEALSGISQDVDSHPLDMRTSAGEPWSRLGKSSGKKKNSYINVKLVNGEKRYTFNNHPHGVTLQNVIKQKEQYARRQIRTVSLWKNCLKDETRPLHKIAIGKTRLFVAAPFETVFLFRKYFGKFKTEWQKLRHSLRHAVGINPVSGEWTELALYLQSKGHNMSDADFGCFDTNLRADFMEAAGRIVIETIMTATTSDEEDRNVMEVLWDEIIRTFHVTYDMVHLTRHGNPSGNPLTTVVNCIVNLMYHWYAYIKISGNKNWSAFENDVGISCFGDDVIYSTVAVKTNYTFTNVQIHMLNLGQDYTTGDKSLYAGDKKLSEICFLKRRFREISSMIFLAPLESESIEQQFNYTHIEPNDINAIKVQIDEALMEASAHGKFYFNEFSRNLTDKIRSDTFLSNNFLGRNYYSDSYQQLLKRIDNLV